MHDRGVMYTYTSSPTQKTCRRSSRESTASTLLCISEIRVGHGFPELPMCPVGVTQSASSVGDDIFLVHTCVFGLHACSDAISDGFSCFPETWRYFSSQRLWFDPWFIWTTLFYLCGDDFFSFFFFAQRLNLTTLFPQPRKTTRCCLLRPN